MRRDRTDAEGNVGPSCEMLFDDEASTWYVCKQRPKGLADDLSCTLLDEPGFADEPGFLDSGARWICKVRRPGMEGWGPFEEVDPNWALRWLT